MPLNFACLALHGICVAANPPPPSTISNVAPRRSTRCGCRRQPGTTLHTANSFRVTRSRGSGHPQHHPNPPEPQARVTGPALPEPPNPTRPWNDHTTIGDISRFLHSRVSINTKVSSLVALHHHLLQQCHGYHDALPGEMHSIVLRTPPGDSKTAPSARASPKTDVDTNKSLKTGITTQHIAGVPKGTMRLWCRVLPRLVSAYQQVVQAFVDEDPNT